MLDMATKRDRHNVTVSATIEVIDAIDAFIAASPFDLRRSAVALAAIREGLPIIAAKLKAAKEAKNET